MKAYDGATALRIYLEHTEIDTCDIRELFDCASNTATRLKKVAMELMVEKGKKTWDPSKVNTAIAYEAWGIDIDEVEKRLKKLNSLKKAGIIQDSSIKQGGYKNESI